MDASEYDYIFTETFNLDKAQLYLGDMEVTSCHRCEVLKKLRRRREGVPVEYLFGKAEFMGRVFRTRDRVFFPRNSTESLVEIVSARTSAASRVLDLCCGCGNIAVSVALSAGSEVTAADIDPAAVSLTRENAVALSADIKVVESDLFEKIRGVFDIIVSNPPYIKEGEALGAEVMCENGLALFAGKDGLDCIRRIISGADRFLKHRGLLFLETGFGQSAEVSEIMEKNGFNDIKIFNDLSGMPRVVEGRK